MFYRSEGVRYSPAVVLLFFHYNDVVYNERQDYFGAPKPAFEMGSGRLRLHRFPVQRHVPPPPPPQPEQRPHEEGSALLEWVQDRLWYSRPRPYNALARLGLWSPMPRVPIRLELRVYERRYVPEIEDAWEKTAAILAALAREVAANGARLLVIGVPSRRRWTSGPGN